MYSRTDHYRRRAIHARQRAAQTIDPSLKADFEERRRTGLHWRNRWSGLNASTVAWPRKKGAG